MLAPYPYRPKEFAFLYVDGVFHLFYIRHSLLAPHEDSTEVDFGHAVSYNLTQWAQLDPVLHVRPGKWDDLHVWSPCIIAQNDTFYMYYTGVTKVPFQHEYYQRIGLATSTDLIDWQRYDAPVFDGNRVPWALADSSQYAGSQFRDSFVMPDPNSSGHWLMYYSTTPRDATTQLIVGVGFNETGTSPWQDLKPLWNTDAAHFLGFVESPCVFDHGGRWYLFFTTNSGHPIRFQHANSPTADSSGWVGTYRLYDNAPNTDAWFAPEFLRVGEHEYFAAVNGNGIEIREMVWSGAATFSLTTPSVVGVAGEGGREAGPRVVALGGWERGAAIKFGVVLPWMMRADMGVYDVVGRRIRVLNAGALPGGETIVSWDKRDAVGREVGAGVYLVRLETPLGSRTAKAPVLR
jgi:beta-fructofuranosidase